VSESPAQNAVSSALRETNHLFAAYCAARDAVIEAAKAHARTKRGTQAHRATLDQLKATIAKMEAAAEAHKEFTVKRIAA